MRKADLPLGGRCLLTCRLLHHADKQESRRRTNAVTAPHACPEGEVRWCSEMVNKRLSGVNLPSRKVGVLRRQPIPIRHWCYGAKFSPRRCRGGAIIDDRASQARTTVCRR